MRSEDGQTTPHYKREKLPADEAALLARLGVTPLVRDWAVKARCQCSWCAPRRRRGEDNAKYRRRVAGCNRNVTEVEMIELADRLNDLHISGVSFQRIGKLIGFNSPGILAQMARKERSARLSTYRRVMALPSADTIRPRVQAAPSERRGGALVDPLVPRRMLEALYADGWTLTQVARGMSYSRSTRGTHLAAFLRGDKGAHGVSRDFADDVDKVYRELAGRDPLSMIRLPEVNRARNRAKAKGYAPSGTWDTDTIQDPDAHPDFTGACGTALGYDRHYKRGLLPACPPCRKAKQTLREERENGRKEAG